MQNPWLQLPHTAPYVLPQDASFVERFNLKARDEHKIHLDVLPEPFLGSPDAPVVLLNLNPGYNPHNVVNHTRPDFVRANRAQLEHRAAVDWPFYLLDPAVAFDSGYRWWSKRLRQPIEELGQRAVASNVLCVEFFPYHSRRCGFSKSFRVPSQEYGFHLVRSAMARNAHVVVMRARAYWFREIPELATYSRRHQLRSVQSPYLSLRNCPDGYRQILDAIADAA